ncbi:hypothetical protein FRC10_011854 [Ceratobasidium sp. 414]|nr:hypothetical protein FRC10_011854 [Ceratobasidium sp. 414]
MLMKLIELHWNNDNPCHLPVDTRRDSSHFEFYADTLALFFKHLFYLDTLHALFANVGTLGLPQGDTIFRDTFAITSNYVIHLPHPLIGAFILALGVGYVIMNSMSAGHCLIALLAAPLTWLPPSISPHSLPASSLKNEWPPLFDDPPNATSLRDFWSNRWHAVFKHNFWSAGGKPGIVVGKCVGGAADEVVQSFLVRNINSGGEQVQKEGRISSLGARIGGVMGVFLMSGLLHDFGMWGMGQGMDLCRVTGYFLIQGVGLIVENALGLDRAAKQGNQHVGNGASSVANGKVSADPGSATVPMAYRRFMKLWTVVWVVLPATMMVDAWLRRGLAGIVIVPHALSPARALLRLWDDFAFAQ